MNYDEVKQAYFPSEPLQFARPAVMTDATPARSWRLSMPLSLRAGPFTCRPSCHGATCWRRWPTSSAQRATRPPYCSIRALLHDVLNSKLTRLSKVGQPPRAAGATARTR